MNVRSFITQSFDNLFSKTKTDLLYPNEFVFEVKFNKALPSWVPSIINKYQLTRVAVSKYAFCLDKWMSNKILILFNPGK